MLSDYLFRCKKTVVSLHIPAPIMTRSKCSVLGVSVIVKSTLPQQENLSQ
jgi:hypothetical protein